MTPRDKLADAMFEEGIAPYRSRFNNDRHGRDVRWDRNAGQLLDRLRESGYLLVSEAELAAALDDAYAYESGSMGDAVLPFVDDAEGFWRPFAAKVFAALGAAQEQGETG